MARRVHGHPSKYPSVSRQFVCVKNGRRRSVIGATAQRLADSACDIATCCSPAVHHPRSRAKGRRKLCVSVVADACLFGSRLKTVDAPPTRAPQRGSLALVGRRRQKQRALPASLKSGESEPDPRSEHAGLREPAATRFGSDGSPAAHNAGVRPRPFARSGTGSAKHKACYHWDGAGLSTRTVTGSRGMH